MTDLWHLYQEAIESLVAAFPLASFGLLLFAGTLPIFLVSPTARRGSRSRCCRASVES